MIINFLLAIIPSNFLRLAILRVCGAKIGQRTRICRRVRVDFPWKLVVGENCFINRDVFLDCRGGTIIIGNNVDISEQAIIYTLSHDIQSDDFCIKKGDVVIGNRCWIGARSIILPKTTLMSGNVLGASSVFSGFADDYNLLIGVPAVSVKKLSPTRSMHVRD